MAAGKRKKARGQAPPKPPTDKRRWPGIVRATRERRRRIQPNPPYVLDPRDVEEIAYAVARKSGMAGAPPLAEVAARAVDDDVERNLAILYMGEPSDPLKIETAAITSIAELLAYLAERMVHRMAETIIHNMPLDLESVRRPIPMTIDQYEDAVRSFADLARRNPAGEDPGVWAANHVKSHPLVSVTSAIPMRRPDYPFRAIDVLHVSEHRNAIFEPVIEPDGEEVAHLFLSAFDRWCDRGAGNCIRYPAAAALLEDVSDELAGFDPRYP